jgi:hypothetical protein
MVLLLLPTLFEDEKIIVAKDLNWNKTNSGFKFMLFCESQAWFFLASLANSASIWAFTSDP